jgi:hypothetical protein
VATGLQLETRRAPDTNKLPPASLTLRGRVHPKDAPRLLRGNSARARHTASAKSRSLRGSPSNKKRKKGQVPC